MAGVGHGEVRDYCVRESSKVPGEGVYTLAVFCKSERVHLITARDKHSLDIADNFKHTTWKINGGHGGAGLFHSKSSLL